MLSFRDRFFTPKVATAMMSPLAIVSAGGGGAVGVVVGGSLVAGPAWPIAAIVGGLIGAVAAWATRVGFAVPRAPETSRIDPFTLAEPWRRLTQDALAARKQFDDAVRRTKPGPIRDRLAGIGDRINATIDEAWATARAGHELADAFSRVDARGAQQQLDDLSAQNTGAGFSFTTQATITALQAQIATSQRMQQTIKDTHDKLSLLNARLDEAVARCIELSVGTFKPDEFNAVEGQVGSITDELEALRSAIEDTSGPSMPTMPTPSAPAAAPEPTTEPPSQPRPQAQ
ncbi:MAG: hypothetical protein U0Q22_04185 [Acidimicrobiales bacterium]